MNILLITVLTIKILFTINLLKKKLFRQNTIYNILAMKNDDDNNNKNSNMFKQL